MSTYTGSKTLLIDVGREFDYHGPWLDDDGNDLSAIIRPYLPDLPDYGLVVWRWQLELVIEAEGRHPYIAAHWEDSEQGSEDRWLARASITGRHRQDTGTGLAIAPGRSIASPYRRSFQPDDVARLADLYSDAIDDAEIEEGGDDWPDYRDDA